MSLEEHSQIEHVTHRTGPKQPKLAGPLESETAAQAAGWSPLPVVLAPLPLCKLNFKSLLFQKIFTNIKLLKFQLTSLEKSSFIYFF